MGRALIRVQEARAALEKAKADLDESALRAIEDGESWRAIMRAASWGSLTTVGAAMERARARRGEDSGTETT